MAINTKNILMPTPDAVYKSPEDLRQEAWYELRNAWHNGKIMTGKLVSAEKTQLGNIVTTDYKGFRIIIPYSEMDIHSSAGITDFEYTDAMRNRIINGMVGCEIDYIIKGMSNENGTETIVASRKEAMERKKRNYFLDGNREGGHLVKEDSIIGARVLSATQKNVTIEMFGVVRQILPQNMAHSWIGDMRDYFSVGDIIPVHITKIERTAKELKTLEFEIKSIQMEEIKEALSDCEVDMRYAGKVVGNRNGIWYVRLYNNAVVQCRDNRDARVPYIGDEVTVLMKKIDMERLYANAIITRIIKRSI